MAPSEYSLRLQKGIAGGFAPPTPSSVYTVTRPKDKSDLQVTRSERKPGEAALSDLSPKSLPLKDADALVTELHSILKELPTEDPPGSEDIYGFDISIAWGSDDLMWCNGGPQGCGGGKSKIQPTTEQQKKFKRAVDIVNELAK